MRRALVVAACTGPVLACGAAAQAPHTMRDSAGIRIVESRAPLWRAGDAWRVADRPSVSFPLARSGASVKAGSESIAAVQDVVAFGGGYIAVALTAGRAQIRCYRRDGTLIATVGEGEFTFLPSLHSFGADSMLAFDGRARRGMVLDRACRTVRQWEPAPPDDPSISGSMHVAGITGDGRIITTLTAARTGRGPSELTRHRLHLFLQDGTGGNPVVLGSAPGVEYFEGRGLLAIRRLPFARESFVAVTDSGYIIATNDTYEILCYRLDGTLVGIMRRAVTPPPISPEQQLEYRKALRQLLREERERELDGMPDSLLQRIAASQEDMTDRIAFPPTFPAYAGVRVDRRGYLWVQAYEPTLGQTPTSRVWSVFDPEGRWLGDLTLPQGFQLYEVSGLEVMGLYREGEGVLQVRTYRLENRYD